MASATEQQQQTTLEFYQAMADFKNMFPQMDDDVIEVRALCFLKVYCCIKGMFISNRYPVFSHLFHFN